MENYSNLAAQLDKLEKEASALHQLLRTLDDRKTITCEFLKALDVFISKVKFCKDKEQQFNTDKTKPAVTKMINAIQSLTKQIRDLSKRNRLMRALSSNSLRRSLEVQILDLYGTVNSFIEEQQPIHEALRKKTTPVKPTTTSPTTPSNTTTSNNSQTTTTTSKTTPISGAGVTSTANSNITASSSGNDSNQTAPVTTITTSAPVTQQKTEIEFTVIPSPNVSGGTEDVLNMIPDPAGRKLWSELGQNTFSVTWSDFLAKLSKTTPTGTIPAADAKALHYILDPSNNDRVTSFKFSEFLKGFGPLDKCIENVRLLFSEDYFHGFLTSNEARALITGKPIGTFLLRFSETQPGSIVVSMINKKSEFLQIMVQADLPHGLRVRQTATVTKTFSTFADLIAAYAKVLLLPFGGSSLSASQQFITYPYWYGDIERDEVMDIFQNDSSVGKGKRFLARWEDIEGSDLGSSMVEGKGKTVDWQRLGCVIDVWEGGKLREYKVGIDRSGGENFRFKCAELGGNPNGYKTIQELVDEKKKELGAPMINSNHILYSEIKDQYSALKSKGKLLEPKSNESEPSNPNIGGGANANYGSLDLSDDEDGNDNNKNNNNTAAGKTTDELGLKSGELKNNERIPWHIDPSQITCDVELGKGVFGAVYKGKLFGTQPVAVKKLFASDIPTQEIEDFKKEVAIMNNLRHPNIVLFMGACFEPGKLMLVTELMSRGSVEDWIHPDPNKSNSTGAPKPNFKQSMKIGYQAAIGMNWLHQLTPPFLHLDLKPANLLIDANYTIKLADFGLSVMRQSAQDKHKTTGAVGSPLYMSPEMLCQKDYDEKVDIYSFGILLWELWAQKEPYEGRFTSLRELAEGVVLQGIRPNINDAGKVLQELFTKCWGTYPRNRTSFKLIIEEQWIERCVSEQFLNNDSLAEKFWNENCAEYTFDNEDGGIKFDMFWSKLLAFIGLDEREISDFKTIAARALFTEGTRMKDKVIIETFAKVLKFFGPLRSERREFGLEFVEGIEDVVSGAWFFGDLDTTATEGKLKGKSPGTFLVRYSSTAGCFTISRKAEDRNVKQYRVNVKVGEGGKEFVCPVTGKNFKKLSGLIGTCAKNMGLKMVCPDGPYVNLFSSGSAYQIRTTYDGVDF
eukprot:TRINITY_DN6649_c0_g1_i2.p1 TRINITY_DN6649_c0_g1~~TRINITY_DN6649_c0_g1_i2.p1  ORF type:complete len:1133 (-),score=354.80 TRINITY_DN6649_c0_g1_i2:85-3483(-)